MGIPTSFGLLLIEAAARKDTTNGCNPHHCGTGATILDRRSAFEAGLDPWRLPEMLLIRSALRTLSPLAAG
jgi:hypothetical protein